MHLDWLAVPSAFFLTLALVSLLRKPATRFGLVDIPGGRKLHNSEVPLIGGAAIFITYIIISPWVAHILSHYYAFYAGMAILFIAGTLDDLRDINATSKLLIQLIAAVFLVSWGNLTLTSLGNLLGYGEIILGDWGIPFTILCVISFVNAFNMIDGMDGLAGGVGLIMLACFIVIALLSGLHQQAIMMAILSASIIGFLFFNFPRAKENSNKIFMGDSGSLLLGYAIAWFALETTINSNINIYPISIAAILILPISDALILIFRRIAKGRSPLSGDREHMHHIFERAGFTQIQTISNMLFLCILTGIWGVVGWYTEMDESLITAGILTFFILHLVFVSKAWKAMRVLRRIKNW